jgi:hypothetical protein
VLNGAVGTSTGLATVTLSAVICAKSRQRRTPAAIKNAVVATLRAADSLDQECLRAAFSELRTTTLFGACAIDPVTGRQIGHKILLVQWHGGRKMMANSKPAGWRLMAASFHMPRLRFGGNRERDADEVDPDELDR